MINYIQPYSPELNIGGSYNEACARCEDWICITDQDTLKFEGFADRVQEIVERADKDMIITCRTNRLAKSNKNLVPGMYEEGDINKHREVYHSLWEEHGAELEPTDQPIAGVFMLFHKSVWEQVKFREYSIQFDMQFTQDCKKAGFKPMVATGLYIFHLYRWGKNVMDISHLRK